jgi:glycosyltransferase A (GT-A) superfamily protein (DUF2064 family)
VLSSLQPLRASARLVVCYAGASREAFREWDHLVDDWRPQPPGDLGDRLAEGFRLAFAAGGPVLALGTDCLEIDPGLLEPAFSLLEENDAVFGPTPDGGYHLVALAEDRPDFFRSIRWSAKRRGHLAGPGRLAGGWRPGRRRQVGSAWPLVDLNKTIP